MEVSEMQLDGLHHLTMITGDAQKNVDFYADLLGLRLVKKTVNFDAPEAYHLYFGDEQGTPGTILTWFEFAGAVPGRPGAGMIHTLQLGVESDAALGFWEQRLAAAGYPVDRAGGSLKFADYDGLGLELVVADQGNVPLRAVHPEVPVEFAIGGVEGARAFHRGAVELDRPLLTDTLGFTETSEGQYQLAGPTRRFRYGYDAPTANGIPGAGTVHHIAWHSADEDHVAWQELVAAAGQHVTPVIDRDYFFSIYFREPQAVLFEIASTSPGFAVDEDPAHLGEALRLPKQHEHLRAQLERTLTPIVNPREAGVVAAPEGGR
jgi:glyoxalase family protein